MFSKISPVVLTVILILLGGAFVIASNSTLFHKTASAGTSPLDVSIAQKETEIAQNPPFTKSYIGLASLYLQKIRETSDSSYYAKIDALMNTAEKIDPKDGDVNAIRASVAMGRHDFKSGYAYIQKAIALNATRSAYYGLKGDADIELGKYDEAVASFQKMVDTRPDFSSWSRIAYIRELYGDILGAKDALKQAISSGSNYPENVAWAYVELGKLDMRDDLPNAKKDFADALRVLPTYTQAIEGQGKTAFAEGNMSDTEMYFAKANEGLPLAQYAVDLGDLYGVQGNTQKASQYYALAQVAFARSISSGVNTDLEQSLFLSDHDMDLTKALDMAKRAYVARPSVYGFDYLSWALYKNGQVKEASLHTKEALQLGENDALILFHQGMIAQANGDTAHAKEYLQKAEDLNPNFSIRYSKSLKDALASLK